MIQKKVVAYGKEIIIGCDGKCNKAWGINSRPEVNLCEEDSDDYDEDNTYTPADQDLPCAPEDPGTYEGGDGKPSFDDDDKLNKWCFRECERSTECNVGEELELPDFSRKRYNKPNSKEAMLDKRKDGLDILI